MSRRVNGKSKRRGATLVIMAVVLTVLMMFGGFGVDFGRMYTFQSQLKVLADAGAMAAAIELRNAGTEANAKSRALALKTNNRVDGAHFADMTEADIEPGTWDFLARTFTVTSWASAGAIRATTRYTADWTLARIFGVTNKQLTQRSIAALGSIKSSGCLKPWAVPYTNLLQTIGKSATDTAYRLTASDVATLRTAQTPIIFKITSDSTPIISGNFYAVKYGPIEFANGTAGSPSSGADVYKENIGSLNCLATGNASVGDWLALENGNMIGPTAQGLRDFCGKSGQSFSCNKSVVVPVWNGLRNSGGRQVQIVYVGAFVITGYDKGEVSGYLTALTAGDGKFDPAAGPLSKAVLVF